MRQYCYHVCGRVQGVGFREFVRRTALHLDLKGYVCNLSDGSVECTAAGDLRSLQELEKAMAKGPPYSRVDSVKRFEDKKPIPSSFDVKF